LNRQTASLQGTAFVRGTSRRYDAQITVLQRLGFLGSPGTVTDLG